MLEGPPDVELPILMDAPEDYAREEGFDGTINQDIVPVGGGHLAFDDEGNAIPEDLVIANDDQTHDIIPVEDNDLSTTSMMP